MIKNENSLMGMSIGTGLAIESLLGFDAEGQRIKGRDHLAKTGQLFINLRTLIRNYHSSMERAVQDKATLNDYHDSVVRDMMTLTGVLKDATSDRIKIIVYNKDYDDIKKHLPRAEVNKPRTPLQLEYANRESQTIRAIMEGSNDGDYELIKSNFYMNAISYENRFHTGFITHLPIDLIDPAIDRYETYLLESHTGEIRTHDRWYTKMKGDRTKLMHLPFNHVTLQTFGDSANMLKHQPLEVRRSLMELANKLGWSPRTSLRRMRREIGRHANRQPELAKLIPLF